MISREIPSSTFSSIPRNVLALLVPPEMVREVYKYCRQSDSVRVTFAPVFKERTASQNALFHAKINEVAKETGADRNLIKREVKQNALYMGYPFERDEHGEPMVDENGELIPLSSKKACISDMKILIESLYEWCFQNDIYIEEIYD